MRRLRLSLFMLVALCSPPAFAWSAYSDDYVFQRSPHDFETTVRRVSGFLETVPRVTVETTDKAALGALRPTVIVTYMRPDWSRELLSAASHMALHLPFRFVVFEVLPGEAYVGYEPAVILKRRYGVSDSEPVMQILSLVQRETMAAVLEK